MTDKEEVYSPLNYVEEFSNSITVDSLCEDEKEYGNFIGVEDGKVGLGSTPLLKSFKGWHLKLWKSFSSIEE